MARSFADPTCTCTGFGPCDAHRASAPAPETPRVGGLAPADSEPLYVDIPPAVERTPSRCPQHPLHAIDQFGCVMCESERERPRRTCDPPRPRAPSLGRRVASAQEHLSVLSREDLDDMAALSELRARGPKARSALCLVRGLLDDNERTEQDRRERGLSHAAETYRDIADTLRMLVKLAEPRSRADSDDAHAPKVQAPEPARETP